VIARGRLIVVAGHAQLQEFPNDFLLRGGEQTMINKVIISAKRALRRMKSKKGQTLVEYALILAFISVVAISVLIALGNQVKGVFTTITSQLAYAGSSH
jgi:Flp pilus assembly pilin Flp